MTKKRIIMKKNDNAHKYYIIGIMLFPIILKIIEVILIKIQKSDLVDNNFFGYLLKFNLNGIIKSINFVLNNINYYATASSVILAVLTLKFQIKKNNDERINLEKENQKKKIEIENNHIKLKEEEIEITKDRYRPTFVIDGDKSKDEKEIYLYMKENELFLENVVFYSFLEPQGTTDYMYLNETFQIEKKGVKKSGVKLGAAKSSFFISAETSRGETILFGYILGKKIYKYLKKKENNYFEDKSVRYDKETFDTIWGSYNLDTEYEDYVNQIFFHETLSIRKHICYDKMSFLSGVLKAETLTEFYRVVFEEIKKFINEKEIINGTIIRELFIDITKELKDADILISGGFESQKKKKHKHNYKEKINSSVDELLSIAHSNLNRYPEPKVYEEALNNLNDLFKKIEKIEIKEEYRKLIEYQKVLSRKLELI